MYRKLPKLSTDKLDDLLELSKVIVFKPAISHRRRMGMSGKDNLSIYNNSKFLRWNDLQRKQFNASLPQEVINKSLVNWFVHFPANIGFLDKLDTWINNVSPAWLTCYLVKGKGLVTLNGETIEINEGEGITYSLANIHSVEITQEGSLWACVMTPTEVK